MSGADVIIGFDTSNYTTSVSVVDLDGGVIANIKRLLPVELGKCGLRQSDALFSHIKALPSLIRSAEPHLKGAVIRAVGVSERPRNCEGSYMPVFLAGISAATTVAATHGVPLYQFSHQCGHIMAALHSSGRSDLLDSDFLAVHASGGTTELLRVKGCGGGFAAERVGGTLDLNAGQVVDRVGVMLGMPFPAGVYMEAEALKLMQRPYRPRISAKGMDINLSGVQNIAEDLKSRGNNACQISGFVLDYLGRAFCHMIREGVSRFGEMPVVCAGGVMCNSIIRSMICDEFDAYFAAPEFSSDNAVGVALLALEAYKKERQAL